MENYQERYQHHDNLHHSGNHDLNVSEGERFASVALGGLLVFTALTSIRKKPIRKLIRLAVGSALIYRGATGHCNGYEKLNIDGRKSEAVNIRTSIIVNKPREEVYKIWRNLNNLSLFMTHIKKVNVIDSIHSEWEAAIPLNNPMTIKWKAEIVKEIDNELLSWQSLPDSTIDNAGKVEFRDALGKQGTEITATIIYRPPAGNIGTGISKLFNPMFRKMVHDDILNFKNFIDSGKVTN